MQAPKNCTNKKARKKNEKNVSGALVARSTTQRGITTSKKTTLHRYHSGKIQSKSISRVANDLSDKSRVNTKKKANNQALPQVLHSKNIT